MNMPDREPWLERSLALLDQSVDAIDASTLSRLARARQHALARRPAQRRIRLGFSMIGFGAIGAAAALVLAFGIARHAARPALAPTSAAPVSAQADGDDIAADDDNAELVEDLDFYAWLDARQIDDRG